MVRFPGHWERTTRAEHLSCHHSWGNRPWQCQLTRDNLLENSGNTELSNLLGPNRKRKSVQMSGETPTAAVRLPHSWRIRGKRAHGGSFQQILAQ
jgi:hypothetical protein